MGKSSQQNRIVLETEVNKFTLLLDFSAYNLMKVSDAAIRLLSTINVNKYGFAFVNCDVSGLL